MIRITPCYERTINSKEIIQYHLNLVADVVPFRYKDVLYDMSEVTNSVNHRPRERNKTYISLLNKYKIPLGNDDDEQRTSDARLAEALILNYSKQLHEELYQRKTLSIDGAVKNHALLRELFTGHLSHGELPDTLESIFKQDKQKPTKEAAKLLYKHVFRYDEYARKKDVKSGKTNYDVYQLIAMMNIDVCPYCNRQFISTVVQGKKRTRAQLDHFKSKEKYPYLALSLNNLIPCCAVCNLLKHADDPQMIYPYDEGFDNRYIFRADCSDDNITALLTGAPNAVRAFKLRIDKNPQITEYATIDQKIETSINTFALRELYQLNKNYVVDLFRQRYILTREYMNDTRSQLNNLFDKKEDFRYVLRLMDYSPENWGQRPLAKLTHDISEQIDELYEDTEYIQAVFNSANTD